MTYIDVTKEWLDNVIPNSHKVMDSYYYISEDKVYIVDGSKKVVLDYSLKELEVAIWIENTFGGEIYMKPRVNVPEGIKTADYWWNGEYWDLKSPKGSSERTIENLLKDKKNQTRNFIIDITNAALLIKDVNRQIENIFKSKSRSWINIIILKKDNYVKIYKRKN